MSLLLRKKRIFVITLCALITTNNVLIKYYLIILYTLCIFIHRHRCQILKFARKISLLSYSFLEKNL